MTLRMKSLTIAFGVSIALWTVMIQGAMTLYHNVQGVDPMLTASINQPLPSSQAN